MKKLYFDGRNVDVTGFTVKRYGDVPTELQLSEKAHKVYEDTDPISIYEVKHESTGEIEYWIDSCIDVDTGLTADELNEELEEVYAENYEN